MANRRVTITLTDEEVETLAWVRERNREFMEHGAGVLAVDDGGGMTVADTHYMDGAAESIIALFNAYAQGDLHEAEETEFIMAAVLVAEAVDAQEEAVKDLVALPDERGDSPGDTPAERRMGRRVRTAAHQRVAQRGADVHHTLGRYRQAREGSPAFADEFVGSTTSDGGERQGWERG